MSFSFSRASAMPRQLVSLANFGMQSSYIERRVADAYRNRYRNRGHVEGKATEISSVADGVDGDVVRDFINSKSIDAQFLRHGDPRLDALPHIKSILCSANGEPLLCLLLLEDNIDFKKTAAALGLRRSKVRIAKAAEMLANGLQAGAVPPFGHNRPLQTLIDSRVLEHERVCSGSGDPGASLDIDTASLVYAAQAKVFVIRAGQTPEKSSSGGCSSEKEGERPQPWQSGAAAVRFSGRVVSKRRLGDCFMFADVVPLETPVAAPESASTIRHLWADPYTGLPARLQLVVGATIENLLGSTALEMLLDQVKIGTGVVVTGKPKAAAGCADGKWQADLEVVCLDLRILQAHPQRLPKLRQQSSNPTEASVSEEQQAEEGQDAAMYRMPLSSISLVDNLAALTEMRSHIFQETLELKEGLGQCGVRSHHFRVVGLDAEWEPSRGEFSPVTLLQISTRQRAFLLDMALLCTAAPVGWTAAGPDGELPEVCVEEAAVSAFLDELFTSTSIVKAGFAFNSDLRYLCRSFPHLPCFQEGQGQSKVLAAYVDVKQLALSILPPTPGVTQFVGLAKLVRLLLGSMLDKSQQVSSWGSRPLSKAQVAYAGADAHVLTTLLDRIVEPIALPDVPLSKFPEEFLRSIDTSSTAAEARMWHKLQRVELALPQLLRPQLPSSSTEAAGLSRADTPSSDGRRPRYRERTPRLPTTAGEHSVNIAALEDFLGLHFPKCGRSVVMQVASADDQKRIPTAVPRYTRGGGIVVWKQAIMLFVNIDRYAGSYPYPNTFPEDGRKVVWFPSPGQSDRHPIIRRMMGLPPLVTSTDQSDAPPSQYPVLLFCRVRERRWKPFIYCGRLHRPQVDWEGGSNGVFIWELQDFSRLVAHEPFRNLVAAANEKLHPVEWASEHEQLAAAP